MESNNAFPNFEDLVNSEDIMFDYDSEDSLVVSYHNSLDLENSYYSFPANEQLNHDSAKALNTMWWAISSLDKDERFVLTKVIGWGEVFEPKNLETIAELSGFSFEKTLGLYNNSLIKVRNIMEDYELKSEKSFNTKIYDLRNSGETFSGVKKIWYLKERFS